MLKVSPLGGARRALEVAEVCGLPCVVSSALETSVGLAAGLALACALPGLVFACGLGTISLLDGDVTTDSLSLVDGYLPVLPTAPEPNLRGGFRADNPTKARWLARLGRVRGI